MKRLFVFVLISIICSVYAVAEETTLSGLRYDINTTTKEATLKFCMTSSAEITIPSTIKYGGVEYPVVAIGDMCFIGRSAITSVTFEGTPQIRTFGNQSFTRCSSLTSIDIPEGVTSIGKSCFSNCTSLANVSLPESLITLGENSFAKCSSLTNVTIPANVQTVGKGCFSDCTSLTSVNFEGNPANVDDDAFEGCDELTDKSLNIIDGGESSHTTNSHIYTTVTYYRTNGANKLATITLPFKPSKKSQAQFSFYEFESVSDDGKTLEFKQTNNAQADVPYLFENTSGNEDEGIEAEVENGQVILSNKGAQKVTIGDWTFVAVYEPIFIEDDKTLRHTYLPTEEGIYNLAEPTTISGYHAYLQGPDVVETFPDIPRGELIEIVLKDLEGNVTSIDAIVVDGKINTITNGMIFDLNGRVVTKPENGIYIVNGQKVLF